MFGYEPKRLLTFWFLFFPDEVVFINQLYYLYDNGKLNDGDLRKALKKFKEDTQMQNLWLILKEELQVEWVKEVVGRGG